MPGHHQRDDSGSFQEESYPWRRRIFLPRHKQYEPRRCNRHGGGQSCDQMLQQNSFQLLAFQLPLPGKQARGRRGNRKSRRQREIVVGRIAEIPAVHPQSCDVQRDAREVQRDGKVNQHDVLSVPSQQHRPPIKRICGCDDHLTITFAVILGWIEQK